MTSIARWITPLGFCLLTASAWAGDSGPVWFLLTETDLADKNDSYLLPLNDPDDIAMARTLIEEGPGGSVGSIATVRIAAGADGFNRDMLAEGEPLWSWHVTDFEGFSDFTIELCDGWPGFVEQDVDGFIRNTNATICFWGYTVTAEVDPPPGYRITSADEGAWLDPDTPGQGIFLDLIEGEDEQLFAAWFTFSEDDDDNVDDTPDDDLVGDDEQRWLTAQGATADGGFELQISNTRGGRFDAPDSVMTEPAGTLQFQFDHCNQITADYTIGSLSGQMTLNRVQPREGCVPGQ